MSRVHEWEPPASITAVGPCCHSPVAVAKVMSSRPHAVMGILSGAFGSGHANPEDTQPVSLVSLYCLFARAGTQDGHQTSNAARLIRARAPATYYHGILIVKLSYWYVALYYYFQPLLSELYAHCCSPQRPRCTKGGLWRVSHLGKYTRGIVTTDQS